MMKKKQTLAIGIFETEFDVNMNVFWYWNYWDASDVNPADDSYQAFRI